MIAKWGATLRSWLMNRNVIPNSSVKDFRRFRMSAWIETSSAATFSSATRNLGQGMRWSLGERGYVLAIIENTQFT